MAATAEEKHWFWIPNSRLAHRFPEASWFEDGSRWDRAACGKGPAVWPAYCGCEDEPCGPAPRPRCKACEKTLDSQ